MPSDSFALQHAIIVGYPNHLPHKHNHDQLYTRYSQHRHYRPR